MRKTGTYQYLESEDKKESNIVFQLLASLAKTGKFPIDDIVAHSHLIKMGNTCNEILIKIKDEIWEYLKTGNIDSAGYFPGDFNRKGGL